MTKADYYEVLEVPRDADGATIKRAFRKAAIRFHPDKNPGDKAAEEKFKLASEAYEVLSDPDKRKTYDTYGHAGLDRQGFHGFSGGFEDIFGHFSDIFGDLFGGGGGGGRGRRAARGADLRYDLQISFQEAAFGVSREITFPRRERCDTCAGSGAKPGTQPQACGTCRGSGRVARQQGFFVVQTTCPVCRGAGRIISERCEDCGGEGMVEEERTVNVTIPAGVDTGVRLRLSGEGEGASGGGARGDLYVFVQVEPHESFQRDGADLYSDVEIPFSLAALGGEVEAETIHGPAAVRVPAGTQPGSVVRLRGKGLPRLQRGHQGSRGDHYVTLKVLVPSKLDRKQKKLLRELSEHGL